MLRSSVLMCRPRISSRWTPLKRGASGCRTGGNRPISLTFAIDYMQLAKVDGCWVIVNVLWEQKPGKAD